jgi:alkylhydroperoxidase family enzyme
MRINPVSKDQAAPAVREVYDAIEAKGGRVSNFYKVIGNWPAVLPGFKQFYDALWTDSRLSAKLKELAYLRTSILNGCEY